MKIITISGKAESGKDTSAKIIKEQLEDMGYNVLIYHYADLLKYICRQFFDWDGNKDEVGRTILQRVGTDVIRKQEPNYWVDFVKSILKFFPDEWDFVLIPDCRFPNEIDLMKTDFDTVSVHITRPGYENHLTKEQRQHPSETALDNYRFDYELTNADTIEEMEVEVKNFLESMFNKDIKESLIDKIKEML